MALFQTGDDTAIVDQFLVVPINGIAWARDQLFAALALLTDPNNWEEIGTATVDQATIAFSATIEDAYVFPDPVGLIFPTANPGTDFGISALYCDGAAYATTDYPALFGVVGYTFGGSGASFRVPDLRSTVPIGAGGTVHGNPVSVGSVGGEQSHTLTTAEMPSHTHTDTGHTHGYEGAVSVPDLAGEIPTPVGQAVPLTTAPGFASLANTGGSAAHENMQPWLGVGYWIVTGL